MDKSKRMSEVGWWKSKPKQTFGTPLYMSPEIYNKNGGGITYLPTVDIWSFGVMMYEVLTGGSFPFGNIESVEDLPHYMQRAKQGRWNRDALASARDGATWLPVISRCLAPNPRDRYQTLPKTTTARGCAPTAWRLKATAEICSTSQKHCRLLAQTKRPTPCASRS